MKKQLKKIGKLIFLGLALGMLCHSQGFAGDVSFTSRVDRDKVALGDVFQLMLTFTNADNVAAPGLPTMDGFKARYLGPLSQFSVINGRQSSSITHRYILFPQKTGTFTLGPFTAVVGSKTYTAPALTVQVVNQGELPPQSQATPAQPEVLTASEARNPDQLQDRIYVTLDTGKKTVFINEKIDVVVRLYVSHIVVKEVHFPVLKADGFTVGEFSQPRQYETVINNQRFGVLEFQTQMFGTRAGEFQIGPVQMQCNLVVTQQQNNPFPENMEGFLNAGLLNSLFNVETYPMDLKSAPAPVTVLALPEAGRTLDFNGAVGVFSLDAGAQPQQVRVGDPVTLTMKIRGAGNFATVTKPVLSTEEGFKTYEPQISEAAGEKIFEQVVLPKNESVKEIPLIRFSFFNPNNQSYETVTAGPIPLQVSGGAAVPGQVRQSASAAIPSVEEKLGSDILYLKEDTGCLRPLNSYLIRKPIFQILMGLPLLAMGCVFAWSVHARRIREDVRYARRLRAPRAARAGLALAKKLHAAGKNEEFFTQMHTLIREYFGNRFHLPSGSVTFDTIQTALRDKNVPDDIRDVVRQVFDDCERARYAPTSFDEGQRQKTWERCAQIIDYFEKHKG